MRARKQPKNKSTLAKKKQKENPNKKKMNIAKKLLRMSKLTLLKKVKLMI